MMILTHSARIRDRRQLIRKGASGSRMPQLILAWPQDGVDSIWGQPPRVSLQEGMVGLVNVLRG